ncbi:hypothetical protein HQ563_06905 [bacterium]|nr:hypothetical protein [bacterium]
MRWLFLSVNACAAMICGSYFSWAVAESDSDSEVEKTFERKYGQWQHHLADSGLLGTGSSRIGYEFFDNDAFDAIVELGPAALPHIVEKAKHSDPLLIVAAYRILKLRLEMKREGKKPAEYVWYVEGFPELGRKRSPFGRRELCFWWWREGRHSAGKKLQQFLKEYNGLRKEGQFNEAKRAYGRIVGLGTVALPHLVEKIREGHSELVPALSEVTDGQVGKDASAADCLDWWTKNKSRWTVP